MALQIKKPATAFSRQPVSKDSGRREDPQYLDWIRQLPCVITGRMPVEAAHISYAEPKYGKLGRGKGRKEDDAWAVPLHHSMHYEQHRMNERKFWDAYGIDPCIVAMALRVAYPSIERATLVLEHSRRTAARAKIGNQSLARRNLIQEQKDG